MKFCNSSKRTLTIELEDGEIDNVLGIASVYLVHFAGQDKSATDTAHDIVNALETNFE
jgi:hypothetical protein